MIKTMKNADQTMDFAGQLASKLSGGTIIELVGDVGAGKTTFVKGLAKGLGVKDIIQSPSFTINRTYEVNSGLWLSHYDLYRLEQAGVIADELDEDLKRNDVITVIEWSEILKSNLPDKRLIIRFKIISDDERQLKIEDLSGEYSNLIKDLQ